MRQGQEGLNNVWLLTSYHCGPCSVIPWGLWEPVLSRLRGEEVGVSVLQFLLSYLWVQLCGV